jgi:rfaE bifunctional protein nucleotidyltransferase chain/domain
MRAPSSKILSLEDLTRECDRLRASGRSIAFTNGTFDILHAGHAAVLEFARRRADVLVVGLNSDDSIRRIKGPKRPIIREPFRSAMLAALECVDYVCVFHEDDPSDLIRACRPDVLVKGADWAHLVVGREMVEGWGGKVELAPFIPGLSTSEVIERVLSAYS